VNVITKTFQFGNSNITFETGRIARQADGAVLVKVDNDVTLLVTVVAAKEAVIGQDFFPLSVHYQEKTYASGRIPGSFFKREARPSEKETLTSRLIDRPIRPLFAEGFLNEVQVICTVLSTSKKTDPDIAAMLGTSAALAISGIPFNATFAAARVGFHPETGYLLNPTYEQLKSSYLDMVVAGTKNAVLMVESEAKELTEDQMLGAVLYGQQEFQVAINAVNEFAQMVNKAPIDWQGNFINGNLLAQITEQFDQEIAQAYTITNKQERHNQLDKIRSKVIESFVTEDVSEQEIKNIFGQVEYLIVRNNVLAGKPRIDGRDTKTVRPLKIEVGVLSKTHGSALFTRGETQALVVATLGTARDSQLLDTLEGEKRDNFMLHYNFPPYSVGECGRMGGTGRREIGHGRLARRGVQAVLPNEEEFPYTIRVVSEITESNGSSSMASVCGASLALMDAGVPIKAPVAGIAMGLVMDVDGKFAVLTDILGDEDHLGDMDFKVAGTAQGVTALQMDIKIQGITEQIMEIALDQARSARLVILEQMNCVLAKSRDELSEHAPSMLTMKIDADKIRDVIGKGGVTIRAICEETKANIELEDDGTVKIYGETKEAAIKAQERILMITAEAEIGKVYRGKVVRILDFGAFVNILPGKDGLVHISMLSHKRVEKVTDVVREGDEVTVVVLDVDNRGRIKLSIKDAPVM